MSAVNILILLLINVSDSNVFTYKKNCKLFQKAYTVGYLSEKEIDRVYFNEVLTQHDKFRELLDKNEYVQECLK